MVFVDGGSAFSSACLQPVLCDIDTRACIICCEGPDPSFGASSEKAVANFLVSKAETILEVFHSENSNKNTWLSDLNGDSSHDWRDMKIQKEQVIRVEDTDGDGSADKNQIVVDDFNDETTDAMGGVLK